MEAIVAQRLYSITHLSVSSIHINLVSVLCKIENFARGGWLESIHRRSREHLPSFFLGAEWQDKC